jgi:hypothetical protein
MTLAAMTLPPRASDDGGRCDAAPMPAVPAMTMALPPAMAVPALTMVAMTLSHPPLPLNRPSHPPLPLNRLSRPPHRPANTVRTLLTPLTLII